MKRRAFTRRAAGLVAGSALPAWLAACAEPGRVLAPVAAAASAATPTLPTPAAAPLPHPAPAGLLLPAAAREFRGAWVATVANIDWPSAPGLPAETQRREALAILERARTLGLNAIILQVRPSGDAIYPSTLEPWTEYLSGEQGKAPWLAKEAPWDPLAFWVQEAHRRGLELHAWFNPYRARHSSAKSPLAASHIGLRQPAAVKRYGDMLWMDPAEPAAAQQTLAVVADVLRRYDIDGVHIDDYFYPYPLPLDPKAPRDGDVPFPDDEAWARYQLGNGPLGRDDWRRQHVDTLVQAMHRVVQQVKPGARFGISPFGLGRPDKRPPGIVGFSQFDKLYADVEKWVAEGWYDYLVPQLYWPIDREGQQYPVLLDYWLAQNVLPQRHLWPGLFTSQVRDDKKGEPYGPRAWPAKEIVEQVVQQRARPAATGHVHFSMAALMNDRDGVATLLKQSYNQPALVPASPWLDATVPPPPRLRVSAGRVHVDGNSPWLWALWRRAGTEWRFDVRPGHERIIEPAGADAVLLAAVSRTGTLGERSYLSLP